MRKQFQHVFMRIFITGTSAGYSISGNILVV
jgi:hypothetical protein